MIRPKPAEICPICKRALPDAAVARGIPVPFCSQRCQQVDLMRWMEGRYAIVEPLSESEEATWSDETVED